MAIMHQMSEPGETILYQEWYGSGHSLRSFWFRLAHANNCLRLIVTDSAFYVFSWRILRPLLRVLDLEHRIPLARIREVRETWGGIFGGLIVTYDEDNGDDFQTRRRLYLHSWARHRLMNVLQQQKVLVIPYGSMRGQENNPAK